MSVLNWLCYKILETMFYSVSLHNMKILMILLSPAFFVGKVIGKDKWSDLAVVKAKVADENIKPMTMGDSNNIKLAGLSSSG